MEYCNGGDLASLLNSVRDSHEGIEFFRPNKILCYALQISEGLEFLHNHQIIHGDLKPANVLRHCTADGHDRILIGDLDDFTQMHHSVTSSYDIPTLRGSIRYLSPEMLKKFGGMPTASPGRVTDIWSFGCILHELLNCGYGVDKRVLHATLLSPENTLIPHYFHMLKNINDNVFVMTVLNGYAPFISELVPSIFREFLEKKLFVNSNRRFTASDVKNALLKIAWKLYPSFTQWRELDDNSVCFCRNTSSHGNPPPSNLKNNILFVHKLKQSGGNYPESEWVTSTSVQQFNPLAKTLRQIQLPVHPHSDSYILSSFVVMGVRLIFQVVVKEKSGKDVTRILAVDLEKGAWCALNANFEVRAWCRTPVVIGNRIYYFETPDPSEERRELKLIYGHQIVKEVCSNSPIMVVANEEDTICTSTPLFLKIHATKGYWKDMRFIPPEHRRVDSALAVLGDYVYITGGSSESGETLDTCLRINLDAENLELQTMCPLRNRRHKHGAFAFDNRVYVFGGCVPSASGQSSQLAQTMEVYDPVSNIWSEFPFENLDTQCFLDKDLIETACFQFIR
ncbi:uncharacterized protein LOC129592908 [Paramacrobiotus metropolitanus]|uniref:uncharacterized protein LOC129592908 n=1 Tax=Paramacrobiotus metropolitanus TaxID=2943436 RepID=UPI0024464ACA|nr:uncharacterized protein LOC129592908 [Paramacrobiotus metropolitanus]